MTSIFFSGSKTSSKDGEKYERNRKTNPGVFYAWPMGVWFSLFFVIPLVIIVAYSFMKRDMFGGVVKKFTLDAYKAIFTMDEESKRFIYIPVLF